MNKLLIFLLTMIALNLAHAQSIEFTVHHAPGGPSDKVTRLFANEMSATRYPVVNRPGAAGRIAIRHLRSQPSMMIATMPQIFVINPMIFPDLDYDPDADLELIAVIGYMPNVLVCNIKLGLRTLSDLKNIKKSLNFGIGGIGSNEHLATAFFLSRWPNNHALVAYAQGGNRHLIDLLSSNIDCIFANFPLVKNNLDDRSKIIPLMTSHAIIPGVMTWQQAFNMPYAVTSQLGLVVSRHLDPGLKNQIRLEFERAFAKIGIAQDVADLGLIPVLKTDAKSLAESREINQRLREFIIFSGLKLQ